MIENGSNGILTSLRRLADTGLGVIRNRAELFAVELQEEKAQLIEVLLWTAVLLFFGMMAVIALSAAILLIVPRAWQFYVAGGLGVVYMVGAIWAFAKLKARLQSSMPFSQTINEVQKDREWLFHERVE